MASTGYSAYVMQGDTDSAADCLAFRNALMNSGNGYTYAPAYGWNAFTGAKLSTPVTAANFATIGDADVAYYSGHGKWTDGDPREPVLNYTHGPWINVAETLAVDTTNWRSTCKIASSDPLRVLILATCSQLDTSIVKYYARVMRASGIRVIAGYHEGTSSTGDDIVAQSFIDIADDGNSVWYSWKNANTGSPWAVLVYEENANQYYRLPGFPGATYTTPSITAQIYRYANFIAEDTDNIISPMSITEDISAQLHSLPLTITTTAAATNTYALTRDRETAYSNVSIADDSSAVENYLTENLGADLASKICVQHYVARDQIDESIGILDNTQTILERTYDYFDTYNGIKIADSYVGASIDCEGINNVTDERKTVVSVGETASDSPARSVSLISQDEAITIAHTENSCCEELEVLSVSLAYAPTVNGTHVLCYEIRATCGFIYVDVQTGDIINWF